MKTPTGIATSLEFFNEWRRKDEFITTKMPDPYEVGHDIDMAVMLLREHAKLEAALTTERARLDHVLKSDWPFRNRDEIDKDIKEAAK